jgi:acyl-[acyl-carrier-protein]-phospholipid O-acyltransferase/long-chain-fatty-acid--[acyl-carrier-protein] ligase
MNQELIPPRAFLRTCRQQSSRVKVADSLGESLTGGQLLIRTLVLRRLLLREVLQPEEKYVGILLPPSAGAVIVNAVMPLVGRIGVNLNYTLSRAELDHCIHQCGIKHVLTTRRVMDKLKIEMDAKLLYLDDFRSKVTWFDKLAGAFMARCLPLSMLERKLGIDRLGADDLLTVIFTSGSTAMPKGVMLTQRNVGSNIEAVEQAVQLTENDVLLGALPFFHSFGYTTTLWTVLALRPKGVYHFSPLDYKIVGKLCGEHKVTILLTTPTFLRGYLKRCDKEDFAALDVAVAGAEKLPVDLCQAFEEKFGVRPVEGYGATELSPLVSVNIPPHRASGGGLTVQEGSVGRPLPGVEAKIVDPDTFRPLGTDQDGMLLIRGPNVMAGYLHDEQKTAESVRDGWYVTGDIAKIDSDGFIYITGRLSRFSKIAGEMVPHLKIEEELQRILSANQDELVAAVTAVPDEKRGERIVVLHKPVSKTPHEICRELHATGLPALFVPSPDCFVEVPEIPLLGSGKLDLKRLKQMALEKFA